MGIGHAHPGILAWKGVFGWNLILNVYICVPHCDADASHLLSKAYGI